MLKVKTKKISSTDCRILFMGYFLCLLINSNAQVKSVGTIYSSDSFNRLHYLGMLVVDLGSHVNGAGIDFHATYNILQNANTQINISTRSGVKYNFSYFGIPGSSLTAQQQLEVSLGFGKKYYTPIFLNQVRHRHTFSYYNIGYYSTDKTTQLSGGLKYRYSGKYFEINYVFENDFFGWMRLDEYRTFAFELNGKKLSSRSLLGLGLGVVLWTGTTKGLGFLHRGEVYNLSNQYGGNYSSGIAYLKFYYRNFSLSCGLDNENIRTAIQDNFHNLIDDGAIPAIDRKGRIFVQLSLSSSKSLY